MVDFFAYIVTGKDVHPIKNLGDVDVFNQIFQLTTGDIFSIRDMGCHRVTSVEVRNSIISDMRFIYFNTEPIML